MSKRLKAVPKFSDEASEREFWEKKGFDGICGLAEGTS